MSDFRKPGLSRVRLVQLVGRLQSTPLGPLCTYTKTSDRTHGVCQIAVYTNESETSINVRLASAAFELSPWNT